MTSRGCQLARCDQAWSPGRYTVVRLGWLFRKVRLCEEHWRSITPY